MKKRTFIISNMLLFIIVLGVLSVAFLPKKVQSINGGHSIGAIYNGNKMKANVSLMINVYENGEIVNEMLSILNQNGVTATFFVGGCWADDNVETLKKIINSGHELGNHGYFHKDHKNLNESENRREILDNNNIIFALTGYKMTLFAPPSGSFSKNTLKVAYNLGYKTIMWSKDTIDWRDSDKSLIIKRATTNLENGDLILMHPKKHTLSALQEIITKIKEQGFNLVSVSKNLEE
ncbi:MAG: polysaccharide deacetylase family protein [Clostridia bacterium]|nr:polysaccharide deacetylase family protein [Clostridia bacterium]